MQGQEEFKSMSQFWIRIFSALQQQGLSFLLLGLMAWYFQIQNDKLQNQVTDCNQQRLDYYKNQTLELMKVVQENTQAINSLMLNAGKWKKDAAEN